MILEPRLSIIIPAYKSVHLGQVFQSLKDQTNQNYSLYVFDDASTEDIKTCFESYFYNQPHRYYHRFAENMGGVNLAKHWNRCLELVDQHEWIWLFSDDDVMSDDCVSTFYENVDNPKVFNVMRFILNGTNDNNDFLPFKNPPCNSTMSCEEFFSNLYGGHIDARMPEFIIKTSKLKEIGGFVPYDLAWRSDNATIMKLTYPDHIFVMPHGEVLWRFGSTNVSGTKKYNQRKNAVTVEFFNWVDAFFVENGVSYLLSQEDLLKAYGRSFLPEESRSLSALLSDYASKLSFVNTPYRQELFQIYAEESIINEIIFEALSPYEHEQQRLQTENARLADLSCQQQGKLERIQQECDKLCSETATLSNTVEYLSRKNRKHLKLVRVLIACVAVILLLLAIVIFLG